jgi:hypothetical protein
MKKYDLIIENVWINTPSSLYSVAIEVIDTYKCNKNFRVLRPFLSHFYEILEEL